MAVNVGGKRTATDADRAVAAKGQGPMSEVLAAARKELQKDKHHANIIAAIAESTSPNLQRAATARLQLTSKGKIDDAFFEVCMRVRSRKQLRAHLQVRQDLACLH